MSEGFLIGPNLRGALKSLVDEHAHAVQKSSVTRLETRFDEDRNPGAKTFRICTFTGSWSINATKTVTFRGVTTTPNTVSAVNLFAAVSNTATKNCAIAKDGTAWYLIAAQC